MRTTIFRAEIFAVGDTPEDAEIAWKRNVRRMMEVVRQLRQGDINLLPAVENLIKAYDAASDINQETPWPESIVPKITALDRLENSCPSSKKDAPPF